MAKYTKHKYFKSHRDIDRKFVDLLNKSFLQINDNIDCIEAYFNIRGHKKRRNGKCITKKLDGQRLMELKIKDTDKFLAQTFGDNITFSDNYLWGCYNSYKEGSNDAKEIILIELAGTIVHEASHACFGSERYAYLIDHFYRLKVGIRNGFESTKYRIIGVAPRSWIPEDYHNKEQVKNAVTYYDLIYKPDDPQPEIPNWPKHIKKPIIGKHYLV